MKIALRIQCEEDKPILPDLLCLAAAGESFHDKIIDSVPYSNLIHPGTAPKHPVLRFQTSGLLEIYKIEKQKYVMRFPKERYKNWLSLLS